MTEDRNQSENTSDIGVGRESALSIRRGWWVAYALLFSIQVIAWTILVVLEEVGYGGADRRPTEIAVVIGMKIGALIVVSIAYTMILLEMVRSIMVISSYLEDKLNERRRAAAARRKAEQEELIAEAVEKAVAETVEESEKRIAEAHQAWADWNRRRLEADERGEPFDETPPEFPQQIGEPK
ncbi:MAG: hypothetical protein F4Y49_08060 [Dehalococcoidia bacterium]|nr:hypothetical protein [Dehalococcoidia bacterium]